MSESLHRPRARFDRIAAPPVLILLAAVFAAAPASPAAAQSEDLDAVERALERDRGRAETLDREAETLKLEILVLRAKTITAARKAQEHESSLFDNETRLDELERDEAIIVANLQGRRAQLAGTLAALQRIALLPADALIAAPGSPVGTVRSAMLLRVAIPTIEGRAAMLRDELDKLTKLRRRIAVQRGELAKTSEALEAERPRIAALIRRKTEARAATTAERQAVQERARRLAAQARDLKDLLARIERQTREQAEHEARELAERQIREQAERRTREAETGAPDETARLALIRPDDIRPFPDNRASLRVPARGRVVLRFGQPHGEEGVSKGISIRARNGAQVVAPFDGKVVYAGPFRRYGQILIIEHGRRYHTLLAGLDRIHTVIGQWLLAGEPVGVLGSPLDGHPELYFELRRAGQPINPIPWLATIGDKVRG